MPVSAPSARTQPDNLPANAYRSVNYRDEVIYGIGALLNTDPQGLEPATAQRWALRVNSHLRKAWENWPWQEFIVTEERAFRQIYAEELNYAPGEEVYSIEQGAYYEAMEAIAAGDSPAVTPEKWALISAGDLDRYFALEQFGKQAIGDVLSVHAFNPRGRVGYGGSSSGLSFGRSAEGIDLTAAGYDTVWLTYRTQQPVYTGLGYDPLTTYLRDDLVFDPETGDCFRSLTGGTGGAISNAAKWYRQRFPYSMAEYVEHMVAADFAEDAGTKADLRRTAEERILHEIDLEAASGVRLALSLWEQRNCGCQWGWAIPAMLVVGLEPAC